MESGRNNRDEPGMLAGKEKKKEKKYYGKFLVFMVLIIIIIEYYSYVFNVKIHEPKKFLHHFYNINNISYSSSFIINGFYINNEYKSRRNSFILGVLYR